MNKATREQVPVTHLDKSEFAALTYKKQVYVGHEFNDLKNTSQETLHGKQ